MSSFSCFTSGLHFPFITYQPTLVLKKKDEQKRHQGEEKSQAKNLEKQRCYKGCLPYHRVLDPFHRIQRGKGLVITASYMGPAAGKERRLVAEEETS